MLSFISKILSQHVALLAATRISPCSALPKCCIHSHSGLSTLLHIVLAATRRASCRNTHFSVLRTLEMLHTFAFRAIAASPHWFVATRISPCFALSKCCIHSHSGLSTLLHIGLSQHVLLLVATRISPCFALSKCCIHSHSGLSPYLLMYVCSANRQSPLPASSHVPCDYRTIATSSSRGMCKLHPYAR